MKEENYIQSMGRITNDFSEMVASLNHNIHSLQDYIDKNCNSESFNKALLEAERFNVNLEQLQLGFITQYKQIADDVKVAKERGESEEVLREIRLESFLGIDRLNVVLKSSIEAIVCDITNKVNIICPPVVKISKSNINETYASYIDSRTQTSEVIGVSVSSYEIVYNDKSIEEDIDYYFL